MCCWVLGITTSGFYAWAKRPPSARAIEQASLGQQIQAAFDQQRGRYGAPRIYQTLRKHHGYTGSLSRIQALMRTMGLRAKAAKNLWRSDITYLWTSEGWLYACCVLDLITRKIVGWSIEPHMSREMVSQALTMAYQNRVRELKTNACAHLSFRPWQPVRQPRCARLARNAWDETVIEQHWQLLRARSLA